MKIAFILGGFPKLSETFVLNQIIGLLKLDHEVDIYAKYNPQEPLVHKDVEIYDLLKRTKFFNYRSNFLFAILRIAYLIFTYFHKYPIKILKLLNIFKKRKDRSTLNQLDFLLSLLVKNYDIIHCHFGNNGNFGVFLKKKGIGGKLVTTFYGHDLTSLIVKYGKNYYKDLFTYGDLFLPICNYFKKILIDLGCNEKKIIVHPLGINPIKFKNVNKNEISKSYLNILSVGRLVEKKGFEYSIKAISNLISEKNIIYYTIIGDGPLRSKLEGLIRELKIEKSVKCQGALEQNEVIKYYKNAEILISPSITAKNGDQEGTPTVLLEAQAMSLPVISTIHSGIPEIVIDGKSGFLVPEREIYAITEKLKYIINNPEKCIEMGKFGRKFIQKNFDIEKLNKKLIFNYQKIL